MPSPCNELHEFLGHRRGVFFIMRRQKKKKNQYEEAAEELYGSESLMQQCERHPQGRKVNPVKNVM